MPRPRRTRPTRHRVGRVSYYLHHGAWHIAQALMSLSRSATGRTDEEEDTGRWLGG